MPRPLLRPLLRVSCASSRAQLQLHACATTHASHTFSNSLVSFSMSSGSDASGKAVASPVGDFLMVGGAAANSANGDFFQKNRVWCFVTKEADAGNNDLPARCLALLRAGHDVAILPGDETINEYAEFCKEVLGLEDKQIIFADDKLRAFEPDTEALSDVAKERISVFLKSTTGPCTLIPFTNTPELSVSDLKTYIEEAVACEVTTLGESPEWNTKFGNKGMLHRHIKDLNVPSLVEELAPDMIVPKGFICSTVQQLMVAFRMLTEGRKGERVTLKPIAGYGNILSLASSEELRFYDFPHGDVVMQEQTVMDKCADGMSVVACTHFVGGKLLPGRPCERIFIGSSTYGIRAGSLDQAYEKSIMEWTGRLLEACSPTGMGSCGFISVEGKPMLTEAAVGAFNMEHFTTLFAKMYAPEASFVSWEFVPPSWMDIWTLWTRLCDINVNFTPGKDRTGVFPLLFVKSSTATVIAIGANVEEANSLRSRAEAALRSSELVNEMSCVALSADRRQIWCHGPRPEYQRQSQRVNLPSRVISLIRPGLDMVILPGQNEPVEEFWEFCKDVLGFSDDQVIFTSGDIFNQDDDMDDSIIARIRQIIASSGDKWTLVPYGVTANFERWATQLSDLDVSVFGEELEWVKKYGQKGILHRHIQSLDKPSVIEEIDPTIRVPKGYVCSTVDDLVEAHRLLGGGKVVVKPVFGAAGEGILFLTEEAELRMYSFPMGDVCLEEFLDLDCAPDGLVLSPAMHYNEGVLIGKGLVDQIMTGTSYAGWRKSVATKVFEKTANRYMQSLIQGTQPKGPGGVDFLSVKGMPVLSDINTGRFNGAHTPKLFCAKYAPDCAFYCWRATPAESFHVYTFWNRLQEKGLAFIPGKTKEGVFPLLFLRGTSALNIAVADTNERAEELHRLADALVVKKEKDALAAPNYGSVARPSLFKKADIMKKSDTRIWAASSPAESRRRNERFRASGRPACLLRPGRDVIILQDNHEGLREYYEFCKELLQLQDNQVIWTSGSSQCLDSDIDDCVLEQIRAVYSARPDETFAVVPVTVSEKLLGWANKLQGNNIKVFGENPEWITKYGDAKVLFRAVWAKDTPAAIESWMPDCKVVKGLRCRTADDLVAAYEILGGPAGGDALIIPVQSRDGQNTRLVGSVEELRLYGFNFGEIVLQEAPKLDRGEDGLPIRLLLTFLKGEIFGQGCSDAVSLGFRKQGLRASKTSEAFQKKTKTLAKRLVAEMKPQGPGYLEFGSINGEPVLLDLDTNNLSHWHLAQLFLETHASGSSFCCWHQHSPVEMDVWTFWSRLAERGIAFTPGKSTTGVFPLLFLRNKGSAGFGTFIAIGKDPKEAEALKEAADEALREEQVLQSAECVSLSTTRGRIWVQSVPLNSARSTTAFEIMTSVIPLVRPNLDAVILPGGHPGTQEMWNFCQRVLGLADWQVIFTTGNSACLDDDVEEAVLTKIRGIVTTSEQQYTLVPYCVTDSFISWSEKLAEHKVAVFGEELEWVKKYGHKGILHRHIQTPDKPSVIEEIDATIRVAKGFVCSTIDDLVEAHRVLDCKRVVLKPVFGGGGEGVLLIDEVEQLRMYDFPMGDVMLEEFLELDTAADGLVLSPAMHYNGGAMLGQGLMDEIIVDTNHTGWRRSVAPKVFEKTVKRCMQGLMTGTKPTGPGGATFVSVGGMPVLCSTSLAQFTGGHAPKLFAQMYAKDCAFFCWERRAPDALDVAGLWKRMKSAGCAFLPGKSTSGVFPLSFLRGKSGRFIAIAKDDIQCMVLHDKAVKLLNSLDSTPIPAQPVQSQMKFILIKNAEAIYAPDLIQAKHILVAGRQIVGLLDDKAAAAIEGLHAGIATRVMDAKGHIVVPGFVDIHVHITGGGGELGPASRTPEGKVQEMIEGGMTTVVGVLGTDCVSRSLENLAVKARALNDEGITAFMWTGAYRLPTPTLTGSVRRDICLIEPCIGAGECAISDHRGSQPDTNTIAQAAADCRVGGMLAGKAGVMYCHMGPGTGYLTPLWKVVRETEIPMQTFLPTHMERSEELIADGAKWCNEGGYIDLTCRTVKAQLALVKYLAEGVPMDHVMVSSDSYGSLPTYDEEGRLIRYAAAHTKAMLQFLWKMYFHHLWPLERILPHMTKTPAKFLKLQGKGEVAVGCDADLLLLDKNTLKLHYVVAKGNLVMTPKWTHAGMFGSASSNPK